MNETEANIPWVVVLVLLPLAITGWLLLVLAEWVSCGWRGKKRPGVL